MEEQIMTMNEIRQIGIKALVNVLGPVGMVRFLQQFDMGKGDYTKERNKLLGGITVQDLSKELDEFEKRERS